MRWVGKMPKPEDVVEKDEDYWEALGQPSFRCRKMCMDFSVDSRGQKADHSKAKGKVTDHKIE